MDDFYQSSHSDSLVSQADLQRFYHHNTLMNHNDATLGLNLVGHNIGRVVNVENVNPNLSLGEEDDPMEVKEGKK